MISIQTAPQIRLVQNNDTLMVEKIQSTLVNTIPLWKKPDGSGPLAWSIPTQAAAAQRQVTDMTNELLRKNAATQKTATIETAKESETRYCGYGNPEDYQRIPDFHTGRCNAHPAGRQTEASGSGSGNGPYGKRAGSQSFCRSAADCLTKQEAGFSSLGKYNCEGIEKISF